MRALILEVEPTLFDLAAPALRAPTQEILESYARLCSAKGEPGAVILAGGPNVSCHTLETLQAQAKGYGVTITLLSQALEKDGKLPKELGQRVMQSLQARGIDKAQAPSLHGAAYVSGNAHGCAAAISCGLVPCVVPAAGSGALAESFAPSDLLRHLQFEPCHKKQGRAPGRHDAAVAVAKARDPRISQLIASVDPTRLQQSLTLYQSFGTRWTYSSDISNVTAAIRDGFLNAGYAAGDVAFQPFDMSQAPPQRNVLCGNPVASTGYVCLCAHYDSTSEAASTQAPGCDDNASGVAVLLETARVLRTAPLARGVVYAAFGGEEQGLFGSTRCAAFAAANGWKIDLIINLDMVGHQHQTAAPSIVIEYDQGNERPENDGPAKAFAERMAQAAKDYTTLSFSHTDIWNSDYMPFEAVGYPCIGLYDGAADQPFYHTTSDTVDKVHLPSLAEVTRLVVASIAEISRFTS